MKDTPLQTIQPVVVPGQLFTCGTFVSLFLSVFPAFAAGFVTAAITGQSGPAIGVALAVYLAAFALILALLGWRAYKAPGLTSYSIYRDRIEIEEGVLTRRRRTVPIGGIIEISLVEGMLQQSEGAGTITLIIRPLVSEAASPLTHQTLSLTNVPQPREVYDLIRALFVERLKSE